MHRPTAPVYSLDLDSLRRAGRFRQPDTETPPEGEKATDAPKPEQEKPADPAGRISALVEERNAERKKAEGLQKQLDSLTKQVDELRGGAQSVADLQKQLEEARTATATRFDKLLETELANLPEAAAKAVKAIPGGSEVQFDWLVANRALFQAGAEEKKGVEGPKNDKKPPVGEDPGASSVAKSYVESRKPAKSGFPGLTG